ncbi:MAG: MipA/OmpV family protein [Xylophilus ampelinus]
MARATCPTLPQFLAQAVLLVLAILLIAPSAKAQDLESTLAGLALGVDSSYADNPYRVMGARQRTQPLLSYQSEDLRAAPDSLDHRILRSGSADLWLRAKYRDDGYDLADGAGTVSAHTPRGKGLWLGGRLIIHTDVTDLQATFMQGASSQAAGNTLSFRATRDFICGPVTIAPRISVTRLSAGYVDRFYGVEQPDDEANRFTAQSTWTHQWGVQTALKLDAHRTLSLDVMTTQLGRAIAHSPLVGRSHLFELHLGYIYRF